MSNDDATERFSELYTTLYGRVRAYAARRVGPDAADEVAAETFTVAWRRFDALPAEPLPWLYGVARNVVARHWAGVARQAAARDALEHERVVSFDALGADDETLWEAWHRLREADREVLALIAWEELSVSEASRVLRAGTSRSPSSATRPRRPSCGSRPTWSGTARRATAPLRPARVAPRRPRRTDRGPRPASGDP